jgi:hypothetical protein
MASEGWVDLGEPGGGAELEEVVEPSMVGPSNVGGRAGSAGLGGRS